MVLRYIPITSYGFSTFLCPANKSRPQPPPFRHESSGVQFYFHVYIWAEAVYVVWTFEREGSGRLATYHAYLLFSVLEEPVFLKINDTFPSPSPSAQVCTMLTYVDYFLVQYFLEFLEQFTNKSWLTVTFWIIHVFSWNIPGSLNVLPGTFLELWNFSET